MTPIDSGVPQGSLIGPLLYALFTNESSEVVKGTDCQDETHLDKRLFSRQCSKCGVLSSYVDDTTYVVSSRSRDNNQGSIVRALDSLKIFLNDNKLAINLAKTSITECMLKQMKGRAPGTTPTLTVEKTPGVFKTLENSTYSRILQDYYSTDKTAIL